MPSLSSLPLETVQRIAEDARQNDVHVRAAAAAPESPKSARLRDGGHARRMSEFWRADSALSLLRSSRWMYEAALPVVWKALDFASIDICHRQSVADLLSDSHGQHVRQLQLRVTLGQIDGNNGLGTCPDPLAVPLSLAAQILEALGHLTWLEITLLPPSPGAYVSQLPSALQGGLFKHSATLRHFGISADDLPRAATTPSEETPPLPLPPFQLDEAMVANLVTGMSQLESLTLHRVGKDITGPPGKLARAVHGLRRLKTLNVLEVQPMDESWADSMGNIGAESRGTDNDSTLRELCLVQCDSLRLETMDRLLHQQRASLELLCLVATPSSRRSRQTPASRQTMCEDYDLPVFRKLHIEAEDGLIDTLPYVERYRTTGLEELTLKYAPGVSFDELREALLSKKWKHLRKVEIGLDASEGADEEGIKQLGHTLAGLGIEVAAVERSSLSPTPAAIQVVQ